MKNPYSGLKDEILMEHYKNGEQLAFEVIYHRHKDKVYSYLHKRIYDKSTIDDIFQNVFIKFHKSKNTYNEKYSLISWIYIISKTVMIDFIKKKKIRTVPLQEFHNVEQEIDGKNYIDINFNGLSDNEQKAIKLRYIKDNEYKSIALILGKTESNTRKIISRGIKKLKLKYMDSHHE